MSRRTIVPTGRESPFGDEELIVTKTDPKGRIIYANDVFLRVSHYALEEVLGQPHSLVRHPAMPRCIFRMMWETISAGGEFFGYIQNLASNGDHYWVFAHVTPSFDGKGQIQGFHSNRRHPDPAQVARIQPVYARLLTQEEQAGSDRREALRRASAMLDEMLREQGKAYDEFVFSL
jgi:PAS domain S-box-containing protein